MAAAAPKGGPNIEAVVQFKYGSPDALQVRNIRKPTVNEDSVLVRVHAAGVCASDWHTMTGEPLPIRLMGFGLRKPKARVRGSNFAGTIESVGSGVTGFQAGDEVFGIGPGAFAEYVSASPDRIVAKPASISFEQAAVIPDSGITALRALRNAADVQHGQSVLVTGAGGGVGTFAVQIAKALGARVTGVCSTSKLELVSSIGADDVIDYTLEDFTRKSERYDVIVDTAGLRPVARLRSALTESGTIVFVGGEGGGRVLGGLHRVAGAAMLSRFVKHDLKMLMVFDTSHEDLVAIRELVESGQVSPVVGKTYPLSEAAGALRYIGEGHAHGKVALTVGRADAER